MKYKNRKVMYKMKMIKKMNKWHMIKKRKSKGIAIQEVIQKNRNLPTPITIMVISTERTRTMKMKELS